MDLKLEIKKEKDYTHIIVHGEVDLYNANELKEKVHMSTDRAISPNLIIDLKDVDYIDSTGLGILIGIKRRTTEKGGVLILVLYSDRINKLFEITGLNKIFTIARGFDAATALLQK
ncbi:MAG: STAS domain-containing protein [bacterium]